MVTSRLNNMKGHCLYFYCNINVVTISKNRTGRLPGGGEGWPEYNISWLLQEDAQFVNMFRRMCSNFVSSSWWSNMPARQGWFQ